MPSGNAGKNKQGISLFDGVQRISVDQIKEDGIRKELYRKERKAEENWKKKWGFFQNSKKLWNKEAIQAGLPFGDLLYQKSNNEEFNFCFECKKPTITLAPSQQFPILSSGMIGWRLFSKENNLNLLVGPTYFSRKQTMNPPLNPEEPDLRYQKVIILG